MVAEKLRTELRTAAPITDGNIVDKMYRFRDLGSWLITVLNCDQEILIGIEIA